MILFESKSYEQLFHIDILLFYLKPQIWHDSFKLVLEFFISLWKAFKISFEDIMKKQFIPRDSFWFLSLQAFIDKVFGSFW